ncbi:4'-phosphopantetheinyl transferase superfamily protein [Rhizobium leguminosarum bv. viciae 248]|uniref:4'-phosphopantetheinyl transferase family protein n=1 Tax=Rhizobium leguminosarum TaxID=384 RepID=UPI00037788FC|nr:4'-phosphopantetheinyl transferase superfamily protein [Rhizobium leguminosarum]NKM64343.1 4'-phosphopantetheinyl transferase superfamily protein [Rhizobium leguminosarum bv. viciae]QHW23264.1 4'-phosphopantetheinyl transferase superfamily protein [Rhizobium leguminosarum bv. viciae 248]
MAEAQTFSTAPATPRHRIEVLYSNAVDVWVAWLPQFQDATGRYPVLAPAERKVAADPARAATRVAIRTLLARYCGSTPADLRFKTGPFGKPELIDSPLSFSASRRCNLALIAVAAKGRLGVDLEISRPLPELDGICAMLHPAERALIANTPRARRKYLFYRIWTRKEAALKAIGTGLAFGLDGFSVVGEQICNRVAGPCLTAGAAPLALHDLTCGGNWLAAVATEIDAARPRLFALSPPETAQGDCS